MLGKTKMFSERSLRLFSNVDTSSVPDRDEIPEEYKWNLKDIYETEYEWEKDFNWVEENISNYKNYEGRLFSNALTLLEALKFNDSVYIKLERMSLYAMLAKDSNMRESKYQAMSDRIQNLFVRVSNACSYIRPEIIAIPKNNLEKMIEAEGELKLYNHFFDNLFRGKDHTLDKEKESLLSLSEEVLQSSYNAFSMFINADMKFPVIKDANGNEIEISHARYYSAIYSQDRNFRKTAYKAYYKQFKDYVNTFAALFNGNLKSNIFISTARKYGSSKEAALDKDNIPVGVYDNLIVAANENLFPLHRWVKLKKRILNLDEFHPYDAYVSIFPVEHEKHYSFEDAKDIVKKALSPLGEDYIKILERAFNNRWIDVHETKGKRSGAYSSGTTFGVHPYVLLNWSNLLNDVFTLAHEMGHNMHSYFTGLTQPFPYANYSIFVAEVASTFNESLLLDYLITNASDRNEKLFLIEKYLNNITSTFYRQTMFAEFEAEVYNRSEKGIPLTPEILCKLYKSLNQKYWGPEMTIDEEEEYTWARVPHFYYNFYVYQYATGFAASEILVNKIKNEGISAVEKYLSFLKAGSSDYPINILKTAGVDMNSSTPVIATTQKMNSLLDEMEKLIEN
jgi:oligoendopeptidase F